MANFENELKDLRDKNNELVQTVQYWKMTAAQRENEKLELMKEINQLRLQLSRLRNGGTIQAKKLDAALQTASEEALSHLVQASGAVARTIELTKAYMRDRQELDSDSPRWSNISGTPGKERVHRVPPLMIGGHSIQPVVSLSRTMLNTSLSRSMTSSNQSLNTSNRAVPLRMLQDVYIPLTRIDTADLLVNDPESDSEDDIEENAEEFIEDINADRITEESPNVTDAFESSRRLDAVAEDMEPGEEDAEETPTRVPIREENALEGPSWLLDVPSTQTTRPKNKVTSEPDSTTELCNNQDSPMIDVSQRANESAVAAAAEFSPTLRRRKRSSSPRAAQIFSPHFSPRPLQRRTSHSGRILKVLVAKMRLSGDEDQDVTPAKRPSMNESPRRDHAFMIFDAPSPNGSTDAGVIVMDNRSILDQRASGEPVASIPNVNTNRRDRGSRDSSQASHDSCHVSRDTVQDSGSAHDIRQVPNEGRGIASGTRQNDRDSRQDCRDSRQDCRDNRQDGRDSRQDGRDSRQSDSSSCSDQAMEGRTRRPRKNVIYKEKPLNRKMRR